MKRTAIRKVKSTLQFNYFQFGQITVKPYSQYDVVVELDFHTLTYRACDPILGTLAIAIDRDDLFNQIHRNVVTIYVQYCESTTNDSYLHFGVSANDDYHDRIKNHMLDHFYREN